MDPIFPPRLDFLVKREWYDVEGGEEDTIEDEERREVGRWARSSAEDWISRAGIVEVKREGLTRELNAASERASERNTVSLIRWTSW